MEWLITVLILGPIWVLWYTQPGRKVESVKIADHCHHNLAKLVVLFSGTSMVIALVGGLSGLFLKTPNEHTKDLITGSFSFAQMALTGLFGILAKNGLDALSQETKTGDIVNETEPKGAKKP